MRYRHRLPVLTVMDRAMRSASAMSCSARLGLVAAAAF